jgi:hypothetical protein
VEFHDFLDRIDAAVPKEQEVHIVLDNYATHKTALVRNWLAKRPRYHLHFTLTHGSWINQVVVRPTQPEAAQAGQSSLSEATQKKASKPLDHNASPKPFRRVKSADQILASVARFARSIFYKKSMTQETRKCVAKNLAMALSTPSRAGKSLRCGLFSGYDRSWLYSSTMRTATVRE